MPQKRSQNQFSFIHASHPDGFKDKELKRRVRRHVMGAVGELRLKPPRNPTISVHIPPTMTAAANQSDRSLLEPRQQCIAPPVPFLGIHPVQTNLRVRQLVHFMQAAGNLRHIPFRYEWYSLASTDATAFYLYLANAALLHSQITLQDNSSESAKYFGICLNQVVERLQEETAKVSPGLMLVIVGFACYDTHQGHWTRRALHLDALERAVKLCGGLDGLQHTLSLIIFWFDVLDSSLRGSIPRYAVPEHLLVNPMPQGTISPSLRSIVGRLKISTANRDISGILERFGILVDFISHNTCDDEHWKTSARIASMLTPISHSLLSMSPGTGNLHNDMSKDYLIELTRLALLIILARLNQAFSFPSDELPLLQEQFRQRFLQHSGSELPDLELWCFTYVALIDLLYMRAYVWHINDLAGRLGIWGSEGILETARGIICVDKVLALDAEVFVSCSDTTHRNSEVDQFLERST